LRVSAAAEWFFLKGTREVGPFTREQIQSLFLSSSINEDTFPWRPGYPDWAPLSAFEEFGAVPPRSTPLAAGQRHAPSDQGEGPAPQWEPTNAVPNSIVTDQWIDESPHPWRRYFARAVDNFFWAMLIVLILGIAVAVYDPQMAEKMDGLFEGPGGRVADLIATLIICLIPNAIMIGLTGGNLGKGLFGICVLDREDRPIGLWLSFKRECRVLVFGLGLGIPIVSLVTLIIAYQKLKKDGLTSWDQAMNLKVVHRKPGLKQNLAYVVGVVLLGGLVALFAWLSTL
jgi:hypothetical protein